MDSKVNIFIAYAREDDALRARLEKHLATLKRRDYINTWYDGKIEAGSEWKEEIDVALNNADIILLLISADFIASDYCYEIEMARAIERHEKGAAIVIPVLLHACDWEDTPFGRIQALPKNGKPITDRFWENPEKSLSLIAKAIKELVEHRVAAKTQQLESVSAKIKDAEQRLSEIEGRHEQHRMDIDSLEKGKTHILQEIDSLERDKKCKLQELERLRLAEQNAQSMMLELKTVSHSLEDAELELATILSRHRQLQKETMLLEKEKMRMFEEIAQLGKAVKSLQDGWQSMNPLDHQEYSRRYRLMIQKLEKRISDLNGDPVMPFG